MGYKEPDTLTLTIRAMMKINAGTRAGRMAAPRRTKNSFIPYICVYGMLPGSYTSAPTEFIGVCRRTALSKTWELIKTGYIWKDRDRRIYLTEDGNTVFSAFMQVAKPSMDALARSLARDAAKYRKEQEQRRPEKGEIVLLYDGCPPDLLTRQRKRKQKTKKIKS